MDLFKICILSYPIDADKPEIAEKAEFAELYYF